MDYVKQFMNDKLHELEHRMDCCRIAESLWSNWSQISFSVSEKLPTFAVEMYK
jgi:hypothetical protein